MVNLLNEFDLDEIIRNMGIAYIYRVRSGIVKKRRSPQEFYEVSSIDIGFKGDEDNIFISLKDSPGEMFLVGHDFEETSFAIDFKTFAEMSKEVGGFKPRKFLSEYEKRLGKFYTYDPNKDEFSEIKDAEFLARNKRKTHDNLDILSMYSEVKKTIISQDEQIKQILASVYKNQKIVNSSLDDDTIRKLKENIIVYGPTGTGKTEILSQVAKLCDVPIVIEDITSFTETGYVGRDVSDMLLDLYSAAGMDLELAERGILVIDEFDKVAEGGEYGNTEGPSRSGVQRSLLKLLDGGTLSVREDNYDAAVMDFNTSKLTVVALGAFSGIKKDDDYSDVSTRDFIDRGIMREVMGRFSKLVAMNQFEREDYKKILLESNLSPINTYQKLFEELGIKFSYDDDLIDYIIDEAVALDCGARSLKTVFDGIISDSLFDVFSNNSKEVHLSVPKDKTKSYAVRKRASENRKKVGFR